MALGRRMELGWCHFEEAVARFGGVGVGLARGGRPPVAPMGDAENINFVCVLLRFAIRSGVGGGATRAVEWGRVGSSLGAVGRCS